MNIGKRAKALFTEMSVQNQLSGFYERRYDFSLNNREILRKVPAGENAANLSLDEKGNQRYYATPIVDKGETYLLCNDWYHPRNEPLLSSIANFANISFESIFPEMEKETQTLTKSEVSSWPSWALPSDKELLFLAHTLTKYTIFLNADIVKRLVDDNKLHSERWRECLTQKNINPDIYLWPGSSCAFPGIRRYQGSREIATFRKQRESAEPIPNAFALDDNDYPKHLWAFILKGQKFQKKGPNGYSLAHICDHKEYKNRSFHEFDVISKDAAHPLFGLYTSPSNTVYTPTSLLKPTDFSGKIRRLLVKRTHALYGEFCNLTPEWLKITDEDDGEWNIDNFTWAPTVGTLDNLQAFLDYRQNVLNRYFDDIKLH